MSCDPKRELNKEQNDPEKEFELKLLLKEVWVIILFAII